MSWKTLLNPLRSMFHHIYYSKIYDYCSAYTYTGESSNYPKYGMYPILSYSLNSLTSNRTFNTYQMKNNTSTYRASNLSHIQGSSSLTKSTSASDTFFKPVPSSSASTTSTTSTTSWNTSPSVSSYFRHWSLGGGMKNIGNTYFPSPHSRIISNLLLVVT